MVKKVSLSSIRSHVDKAEDLLKEGSYDSLLYACLEVRFAIERLTYSKLDGYLDQVPYEVVKVWQPGKLMKTLAGIDSQVESSGTIRIFSKDEHGNQKELTFEVFFESFTGRWASKTYHTLSSFLHTATLDKIDAPQKPYEEIQKKLVQFIAEINRVIDAPVQTLVCLNGVKLQCKAGCCTQTVCNTLNLPKNRQVNV